MTINPKKVLGWVLLLIIPVMLCATVIKDHGITDFLIGLIVIVGAICISASGIILVEESETEENKKESDENEVE